MWAHRKKVGIYKVGRETLTEYRDTETLVSGIQALYHYGNKFLLFKSKICHGSVRWLIYTSDSKYYVLILV